MCCFKISECVFATILLYVEYSGAHCTDCPSIGKSRPQCHPGGDPYEGYDYYALSYHNEVIKFEVMKEGEIILVRYLIMFTIYQIIRVFIGFDYHWWEEGIFNVRFLIDLGFVIISYFLGIFFIKKTKCK